MGFDRTIISRMDAEKSQAKARTAADVITAAQAWVENIGDHPSLWGDTEDFDLIRAVRTHVPGVNCRWLDRPEYAGWRDNTAPIEREDS